MTFLRRLPLIVLTLAVLADAGTAEEKNADKSAEHEPDIRCLFLGDQGHHQPPLRARQLIPRLENRGIEVTYTEKVDDLNEKTLANYDCLIIYANIEKIAEPQETALLKFVADGGGLVPIHCASYCFLNSDKYVELVGAQFQRHGTGTFRVQNVQPKHPIMVGYGGFESWDETYVHHRHNEENRVVLETRAEGNGHEPWTWVRTHGKGRVFYTAWGHDQRTWGQPGFHNLIERGIRWASGSDDLSSVPVYKERPPFVPPKLTEPRKDVKPFEYVDVGPKIPDYRPGRQQGKPRTMMQKPLPPEESMKHIRVPEGFRVELFADERNFAGKPIAMNWDERGRLWLCETVDYPNELQPKGQGRDRIRICEDTDGDWKADKFTVFAEKLSIPTAVCFYRGGAIVQNGSETLYLKDTDGDDVADVRHVLITGWSVGDTHGGVSNFRYGLDNCFWGMQGYNNSAPAYDFDEEGKPRKRSQPFRMGFFRFKLDANDPPNVTELEFVRSTNNNTWGLGFSEEGHVFGSTANHNPSVYMPIANRYYERVRGWAPKQLGTIADTHKFDPVTENVRQVDHHGGYTAAAGHALYTARRYPQQWWNRTAFVCGPTGHLVGTFVLTPQGADFTSTSPCNLFASDDEWTAPIAAEVGPDGNVWVLDWYNYIVQHNPTPHGFKNGRGNAYVSDLRDKKHGRIYRVVYGDEIKSISLAGSKPEELVAALKNDNMLWRLHAQRLLVERGERDVVEPLTDLLHVDYPDDMGMYVGAIHALRTLHGLRILDVDNNEAREITIAGVNHPSDSVKQNALAVVPHSDAARKRVLNCGAFGGSDHLKLAALLALADLPSGQRAAGTLVFEVAGPDFVEDRWLLDAATSAMAAHDGYFLPAFASSTSDMWPDALERATIAAEHFARGRPNAAAVSKLLPTIASAEPEKAKAIIAGVAKGWPQNHHIKIDQTADQAVGKLMAESIATSELLKLGPAWGSSGLDKHTKVIVAQFRDVVSDEKQPWAKRSVAARKLAELKPNDIDTADWLVRQITPQLEPDLAIGLVQAAGTSRADGVGQAIVKRMPDWTPTVKAAAMGVLLSRPDLTQALLAGAEEGKFTLADLSLDQQQALANHPNKEIAAAAKKLLAAGGGLPDPDRQKVLEELLPLTQRSGDIAAGKVVFTKQCAKCHTHSGEGKQIGPDLTGMAVHPKKELLVHLIDPSRDVEGNFRVYNVTTDRGKVYNGLLAGETKTTVEIIDSEGKSHTILREEIDELYAGKKSLMPEGFEKQVTQQQIVDLLEFLTARGQYLPLDLAKAATIVSTRGMFYSEETSHERLIFPDWKPKVFDGVPFTLVDPQGQAKKNVIMLHGPTGKFPPQMPKAVSLPVGGPAKAIHLLSGVSGWGFPANQGKSVSMIVRLHYEGGDREDHELKNGVHFADYIRKVDVPESKLAFMLRSQQIRYLAVYPKTSRKIERVEFVKGPDASAPIVMAVTVEAPQGERK